MFSNVNRDLLWALTTEATKVRDLDTTQRVVDGVKRGQSERFFMVLGELVTEMFSDIEGGYYILDPYAAKFDSSDVTDGMIPVLLRRYGLQFAELSDSNIAMIRNVLDEIFNAWRLKGTDAFINWILGKFFGWKLKGTITLASSVLRCSVNGCTLYDQDKPWEAQMVLYDETQLTPDDKTTSVVDVKNDVDFWIKKDSFEKLMADWGYPRVFKYINY